MAYFARKHDSRNICHYRESIHIFHENIGPTHAFEGFPISLLRQGLLKKKMKFKRCWNGNQRCVTNLRANRKGLSMDRSDTYKVKLKELNEKNYFNVQIDNNNRPDNRSQSTYMDSGRGFLSPCRNIFPKTNKVKFFHNHC